MPTIHVEWRRVIQVKPYETETLVLGWTDTVPETNANPAVRAAEGIRLEQAIFQQLSQKGDELVLERLKALGRQAAATPTPAGSSRVPPQYGR